MLNAADVMTRPSTSTADATECSPRIALVAFSSLGDGLIYLMMAENLRLNGYRVTYIGNIGYQLRDWLPQFEIKPYPPFEKLDEQLAAFDLAIMSPPQFLREKMDAQTTEAMRKKYLLICQNAPAHWHFDLSDTMSNKHSPQVFSALSRLLDSGGSIRYRDYSDESVVDITLDYMQTRMNLSRVTRHVALKPPDGLEHRRHRQRIVISPDSAWPLKKDWSPRAFLHLCKTLDSQGYDPKIVVAPSNHDRWLQMTGNTFDTPVFDSIGELAAFIYESGAIVANDSGNGHLASFLGIPAVTIYRKRNRRFHWRPDWGPVAVVCPRIILPGLRGPIWRPFVREGDVVAALKSVL